MAPLNDPRTRHPRIEPPERTQQPPGLDRDLEPQADIGLNSYQGNGRLQGRRALITGGDSGIGSAVAVAFAREGAHVAISYLPEEEPDAQRIVKAIEDAGQKALALPGDLRNLEQCERIVEETVKAFGGLDILVNNASHQVWHEGIENIPDEDFDATMKSNIYSSYRVTKVALAHLEPGSSIIFTSSVQAHQPSPEIMDYSMTKAAMDNLSKGLARQLAPRGVRVNAVAPGPVWTPMQNSHGQPPEKIPSVDEEAPIGRAGQPVELVGSYVFLASDEASYVTGENLGGTGGMLTP